MVTLTKTKETSGLRWPPRPKRDDTMVARRRIWTTKCKRYRVVHSHIIYGEGSIPDAYQAMSFDPHYGNWNFLPGGRHRTKKAAMRHCEQDAAEDKSPPH